MLLAYLCCWWCWRAHRHLHCSHWLVQVKWPRSHLYYQCGERVTEKLIVVRSDDLISRECQTSTTLNFCMHLWATFATYWVLEKYHLTGGAFDWVLSPKLHYVWHCNIYYTKRNAVPLHTGELFINNLCMNGCKTKYTMLYAINFSSQHGTKASLSWTPISWVVLDSNRYDLEKGKMKTYCWDCSHKTWYAGHPQSHFS